MIFSGDLNSPPDHPAYQFIKEGKLSESIKQNIMDKTDFEKLDNVSKIRGCLRYRMPTYLVDKWHSGLWCAIPILSHDFQNAL